ncbi:MAG: hypothetical protein E4H31_02975 [Dehalococcoidia bacterium]|nr:MAG: hypothetical protein E4H31_02975 [Dehalococcoidia bacterium]
MDTAMYNVIVRRTYLIVTALCLMLLTVTGCESIINSGEGVPDPTTEATVETVAEPAVTEAEAVAIASAVLPDSIIPQVTFTAEISEGQWTVKGALYRNIITQEELGWNDGAGIEFLNFGLLPEGNFRLLVIELDAMTGDILYRLASDSLSMAENLPVVISPACGGCE